MPLATRRQLLRAAVLAAVSSAAAGAAPAPAAARRKPGKPLIAALVPLVRTRDALESLRADIEGGRTNRELGRVMRVLLRGNDLGGSVREAGLWLPAAQAERAEADGRAAIEFLDQVLAYYSPVEMESKPLGEYLAFALRAIEAAGRSLDGVLACFPPVEVANAREQLTLAFPPS
jgi:hypothetical protein